MDGTSVPVDILLRVAKHRDENLLKQLVRDGKLSFYEVASTPPDWAESTTSDSSCTQFKTLQTFLTLPEGIEQMDAQLAQLIDFAQRRQNPNGIDLQDYVSATQISDVDDSWCSIS
jgi:hypothetical protein